ncbi:MAG: flagellar biosynthetic protein FliR [Actinomycetia bacterium]|nr:flagellar biosynthetic protein FliR [Actinomycetes bacterium]
MVVTFPWIPVTLALARVLPVVAVAPFGALGRLPTLVRPAFALVVALAGGSLAHVGTLPAGGTLVLAYASNLLLGALVALVAFFAAESLVALGAVLDASYGWAFVQTLNPLGVPTSLVASLFGALVPALFLEAGGLTWLVAVLWRSFATWPLGRVLAADGHWFSGLATFAATVLMDGVGIALPFALATLALSLVTGVLARVLPQAQVLSVQFPVVMGLGVAMLVAALPGLGAAVGTLLTTVEQAWAGLGAAAWGA